MISSQQCFLMLYLYPCYTCLLFASTRPSFYGLLAALQSTKQQEEFASATAPLSLAMIPVSMQLLSLPYEYEPLNPIRTLFVPYCYPASPPLYPIIIVIAYYPTLFKKNILYIPLLIPTILRVHPPTPADQQLHKPATLSTLPRGRKIAAAAPQQINWSIGSVQRLLASNPAADPHRGQVFKRDRIYLSS